MSDYKPGEIVDITIRGARVHREKAGPGFCVFVMDGGCHTIFTDSDKVTIDRVAPAEWPPRQGDLWRDREGDLWLGVLVEDDDAAGVQYTVLRPSRTTKESVLASVDEINQWHGPLTLEHREEAQG